MSFEFANARKKEPGQGVNSWRARNIAGMIGIAGKQASRAEPRQRAGFTTALKLRP
jgi:hypothetical protein